MPRRPKSGPPYTDIPEEVYVVVTNPWGMHDIPRSRSQGDFNRIASWAQYALQKSGLGGGIPTIECIYGMGTRDEIILQFAEGTNIIPLLGKHRWADFWERCPNPNDSRSTCVFLYNWKNNGDPANHNWSENFPNSLPLDSVPAKSPYPAPSWTHPPSTLVNLVLPIPHPPIYDSIPSSGHSHDQEQSAIPPLPPTMVPPLASTKQRDRPKSEERHVAQDLAYTDLFRPYEPPSQHPSRARFLKRSHAQCEGVASSPALPPSPKFIKKLDPYELEEDALDVVRSSNFEGEGQKEKKEEDVKPTLHLSIKAEITEVKMEEGETQRNIVSRSSAGIKVTGYKPSQALVDAFDTLCQTQQSLASHPTHDPRGCNTGYKPSQALIDAFNALHQTQLPASDAACDPGGHKMASPTSSGSRSSAEPLAGVNVLLHGTTARASGNVARSTPDMSISVKRECEDDVTKSLGQRKKIKIEED